ncbi:uncharacterized protein LOC119440580 [Dermacentor silvarum]|uniref:uncharacterized protein LOC119440580 n=1 Tax=Dermacentor silvarum TaxID=543639 RepID=UPI002101C7CF|nr:uncharacterized protein LOC119440580 [Dermacentor silvarum]
MTPQQSRHMKQHQIRLVWKEEQELILQAAQAQRVKLAGDGRADSPGFSAKFGTYSLLDVEGNKILHFELVQSNEVDGSCKMELEGLKRCITFLESKDIRVKSIVTDRHAQIKCFMRKEKSEIIHEFDVWHVAKGINRKLIAASKKAGCEDLVLWTKSIVNHLYWSASSSDGNKDSIVPKWISILNHIQDIHSHENELFPTCAHGDIEPRAWLSEESKSFKQLKVIAASKQLLRDMPQLATRFQTYGLETFHGLILHFAPKSCQYSYEGMKARTQLAALHYNENSGREQASTKAGTLRWRVKFPKATGGTPVACPVKEKTTYRYVERLLDAAMTGGNRLSAFKNAKAPPPLSSAFAKVAKEELVKKRLTRFNRTCHGVTNECAEMDEVCERGTY